MLYLPFEEELALEIQKETLLIEENPTKIILENLAKVKMPEGE